MIFLAQVMREYTVKVDKLEEAENLRQTEEKEAEFKPVAMGETRPPYPNPSRPSSPRPSCHAWSGCRLAAVVQTYKSQPDDT
jgi:hypothetical protein